MLLLVTELPVMLFEDLTYLMSKPRRSNLSIKSTQNMKDVMLVITTTTLQNVAMTEEIVLSLRTNIQIVLFSSLNTLEMAIVLVVTTIRLNVDMMVEIVMNYVMKCVFDLCQNLTFPNDSTREIHPKSISQASTPIWFIGMDFMRL